MALRETASKTIKIMRVVTQRFLAKTKARDSGRLEFSYFPRYKPNHDFICTALQNLSLTWTIKEMRIKKQRAGLIVEFIFHMSRACDVAML